MKREKGSGGGGYKKRAGGWGGSGGASGTGKAKRERKEKPCPAFKKINGTNIIVDGFQYKSYSVSSYFLTHFHSDHYTGITKGFDFGLICTSLRALGGASHLLTVWCVLGGGDWRMADCSEITAKLMFIKLGVSPNYVRPLSSTRVSPLACVRVRCVTVTSRLYRFCFVHDT
jgi:hypothetical protein